MFQIGTSIENKIRQKKTSQIQYKYRPIYQISKDLYIIKHFMSTATTTQDTTTSLKGVKTVELYKAVWNKWDRYILFVGYVSTSNVHADEC